MWSQLYPAAPHPHPPAVLTDIRKFWRFFFVFFSEAYQCGSHQVRGWVQLMKYTSTLVCVSHQGADPVWGEETLTKGFLVKPNGLSLPDANRGFSTVTQVLLKKASALISLSTYSSLWAITTQSQSIHKETQQPFPCDWYASVTWPHFSWKIYHAGDTVHQELEPLTRVRCVDSRTTRQFSEDEGRGQRWDIINQCVCGTSAYTRYLISPWR